MKAMLNTPIKAFHKPELEGSLNSPGAGGDADNTIQEGDIPGQFTRLMTKGSTKSLHYHLDSNIMCPNRGTVS